MKGEPCIKPAVGKSGYCAGHLWRFKNGKDMDAPFQIVNKNKKCKLCNRSAITKGFCRKHYEWSKRKVDLHGEERVDEEFSYRFYKTRMEKGLTIKDMGDKYGLHIATMSKWENGRLMPKRKSIVKYAKALGVSADWLAWGAID